MIVHEIADTIATITLDAPATRNALSMAGWQALTATVETVAAARPNAVVLRAAAAGMFCSGSDLREIAGLADDAAARAPFRLAMRAALAGLAALPMPVIAAIDGDCFGAGVALALAADVRIAGPRAVFAITPARLGITYPQQDIARLIAAVGPGQAARLLYGAARIDATEAARIGLVEILTDEVDAAAIAMLTTWPRCRQPVLLRSNRPSPVHRLAKTRRSMPRSIMPLPAPISAKGWPRFVNAVRHGSTRQPDPQRRQLPLRSACQACFSGPIMLWARSTRPAFPPARALAEVQ